MGLMPHGDTLQIHVLIIIYPASLLLFCIFDIMFMKKMYYLFSS